MNIINQLNDTTGHDLSRYDATDAPILDPNRAHGEHILEERAEQIPANMPANNNTTERDKTRLDTTIHDKTRQDMTDRDNARHDAKGHDKPDDGAAPITNYTSPIAESNKVNSPEWIELDETIELLREKGILRTIRTIQRYCQKGKLTCTLTPTETNARYLVEKNSVYDFIDNHIHMMPNREPTLYPENDLHEFSEDIMDSNPSSNSGTAPHPIASKDDSEIVELLKQHLEFTTSQLGVANNQIQMKDEQITALLERDHETNVLLNNLQNQLALPTNNEPKHNYHNQTYDIHPNQSSLDG